MTVHTQAQDSTLSRSGSGGAQAGPRHNQDMPTTSVAQPFVLTLRLDAAAEKILTGLRTKYFPSHRNYLAAHVTLFHALPAVSQPEYARILRDMTQSTSGFRIGLKNPFMLGKKGVGINVASFKLREFHRELQTRFRDAKVEMTEQDERPLRAHVTIQNKVRQEEAEETLKKVKNEFEERAGQASGLTVWRYEVNGEWTKLHDYDFRK